MSRQLVCLGMAICQWASQRSGHSVLNERPNLPVALPWTFSEEIEPHPFFRTLSVFIVIVFPRRSL